MFEKKFYAFWDKTVSVIRVITGLMIGALLLVVVFQVIWRGILNKATPWTEEMCNTLITYVTFIGGIAVLHKGEHLAIDLVSEHVSGKVKNAFQILYIVVYLLVSLYLAVYGAQLCFNPMIYMQKTTAMQIPRVVIYAIMPICMGIQVVYCAFDLFFSVRRLFLGRRDRPADAEDRSLARGSDK